jgi:AcrR family transcriptional regulator
MIGPMNTLKGPKRRNAPETKAKILAAAQKAFSELGYAEVGIRDIAAIAGVDSSMLLRYFGSKAGLFEAALVDAMHYFGSKAGLFEAALIDARYFRGVFEKGRSRFGQYLSHLILNAHLGINPTSMMALSAGHPEARDITTRMIRERILGPLAKGLGPPRANARALQIVLLSVGFVLHTKVPLTPVSKAVDKNLAAWFARTIQAIVDQPSRKPAS